VSSTGEIDRLVATAALQALLVRRGRAADGKSPDTIVAQHVPGSRDSHGIFDGSIEEFAEYLRTHNYQDRRYGLQRHTIGNVLVTWRAPDAVAVESYHLAYHRLVLDGQAHDVQIGGRYLDECVLHGGKWLILSRAVVYDWSRSGLATAQTVRDLPPHHMAVGVTMSAVPPSAGRSGEVEALVAKQQITQVLYQRARAGDRRDVDLALTCYHPGATENHEGFDGTAVEFISTVSMIAPVSTAPVSGLWHFISNIVIDLRGDEADVESYHIAVVTRHDDGHETQSHIGGRYLDRFAYRDGRWAIAHRDVVFDWSRVDAAGATYWDLMHLDETKLLRGRFGADDPLYTVLGVGRG
jgi:3-phenylpropionate/cinnamic acid dioxygenase small subunit